MKPGMFSGGEESPAEARGRRLYGALCLAHAAVVLALRAAEGRAAECLWLCHVAEWATAAGFLLGLPRVAGAAVASIAVIHALWIADAVGFFLRGRGPLGIVYLEHADAVDWFVAAPHFYAAPIGAWLVARRGWARRGAWIYAAAAFAALVVAVRAFGDPTDGVNAAFRPIGGMERSIFSDLHFLGPFPYVLGLVAGATLAAFWPGAVLVQLLQRAIGPRAAHATRYGPARPA